MKSRFVRLLTASLFAAAILAQVAPAHADPAYEAPVTGSCYNYTAAELQGESTTSAPVDCAATHNAKVVFVGYLPSSLNWDTPLATIYKHALKTCDAPLDEALGRSHRVRQMSAYSLAWFIPTEAQQAAGARWFHCDVILMKKGGIQPLPSDTTPILPDGKLPKNVAMCFGLSKSVLHVTTCNQPHVFKVSTAFTLSFTKWPGLKNVQAESYKRCDQLIRGPHQAIYPPSKLAFKLLGDRLVVCAKPHTAT